jgi:CHASE2 domain-containing sensor protein
MLRTSRWGNAGLVIGIAVALAVWILYEAGWLEAWDGMFYDRLHSWTTRWRYPKPNVLLLRLGREDAWSDAEAIKTLEVMESLGARAIVINFVPYHNSREFFQKAAEFKNVMVGRELRPDPDDPDALRLDAWPVAARGLDLPWGVMFLPPSHKGVHRWQQAHVTVGTNILPTLERRAVALCDPALTGPGVTGSFLINFAGGPGTLPNIALPRLLAGDLIAEMVKGKVVLVGRDEGFVGVETPVCGGAETMSLLEFQGNALQTLLEGRPIRPLPWFYLLLLLIGLGVVSSLLYEQVNSVSGARVALGILLISVLVSVAALGYFRCWVALGPLVLAQVGQFAVSLVYKARMTNHALNEMRLRALTQIEERFSPRDVLLSSGYWDHLASMINQTLDVGRMVFFERIPQTPQLQEIKAFNCKFEDVRAKEHTLESAVYSEALTKGGPVRVSGFFEGGQTSEAEYVCPLVFSGEVLGMWIVGVNPTKAAAIPQFEIVLMKFSNQIARLLYRKKRVAEKRSPAARMKAWLSTEKEDPVYRELRSIADLLEQYYDVLDTVFSQVSVATIVYDSFGRVLKANEPALALLQPENFVPTRATALEFLRLVTGQNDSQVRQLLRNVLLERSRASMSVKLAAHGDRQFLLQLYPLPEQKQTRPGPDPFSVQGMVCELIETTSLTTLSSLKSVVADRLGVELRNHLAAIEISAALLETDTISRPERQALLDAIHYKMNACVRVLSECQKYLGRDADASAIRCFPLDALQLLNQVCSVFAQKADQRRVTFKIQQPHLMAHVLASTTELTRVFSATLELLLKDAAENTGLAIEVEDVADTTSFRFANCGFGIPNDRLQEILTGAEGPDSEEFQVLREASSWVRNWDGSIEIASDVGKGYSITLRLRHFPLIPFLPPKPA